MGINKTIIEFNVRFNFQRYKCDVKVENKC